MFFLQAEFIGSRVVRKNPEEIQGEEKEKWKYYFGLYRTEVCRKTFTETLDITVGHIQSINNRRSDSGDIKLSKKGKRE